MGYFKENGYINEKSYSRESKEIVDESFKRLSDICLEELMLSSDAYVCMIELNLHGFKRLHRFLSKEFQNLYLDLQKETFEHTNQVTPSSIEYDKYKPKDLKEHLESWSMILEKHLKEIGIIIKSIFEEHGFIPCVAQELQKILYRNLIKNERAIKEFEDCDWAYDVIYRYDKHLHKKMKKEEETKHGYKDIHERHK